MSLFFVAVVNPCKGGTVVEAAATAGYALNYTFKSKMPKAAEACQREGVIFALADTTSFKKKMKSGFHIGQPKLYILEYKREFIFLQNLHFDSIDPNHIC